MKYVINETKTNVSLVGGKYLIPIGGWTEMRDDHANSEEVGEAVRRGWIKIALVQPGTVEEFKPDLPIEKAVIHGSTEFPKPKAQKKAKEVTA